MGRGFEQSLESIRMWPFSAHRRHYEDVVEEGLLGGRKEAPSHEGARSQRFFVVKEVLYNSVQLPPIALEKE